MTLRSNHDSEQAALLGRARGFVAKEVEPHAARIDREAEFPRDIYRRIAEEGWIGLTRPEGAGATLGAFALTEPTAGSDAAAIETRAERNHDSYVLTGTKAWITLADVADWAVVLAKTDPEAGTRGITAFLVERAGFRNGEQPYEMMGQRGTAVGELHLEGCRVPESAMVGEPGEGFKIALRALDSGRIGIAALAVGIARAAFEAAVSLLSRHPVDAGGHGHRHRGGTAPDPSGSRTS